MRIQLLNGPYWTFLLCADNGCTRLVQHDGDYTGVARAFGWAGDDDASPETIWDAYEFLERQVGEEVDDSGYS